MIRPRTSAQLHAYVRSVLGFDIPRVPIITGHDAPFDYVQHAFFEDANDASRDCVVWANRGGGKTQIAAIVTLLDLLFKPGIEVRILGGSFDQSSKMYRYLRQMLETDVFCDLIAGNLTGRHVELVNGSRVEVLSQSQRAVRGQLVHKLRCDEVELFDPDIWEAAQLVTRSGHCGPVFVRAAIETLSTMHKPFGLMQQLVRDAPQRQQRVFRWSVIDTLQHCDDSRLCAACPLWDECGGRAKSNQVRGFIDIDDAITQKQRVTPLTWKSEMLCEQPSRADSVYPEFERDVHVIDDVEIRAETSLMPAGSNASHSTPEVVRRQRRSARARQLRRMQEHRAFSVAHPSTPPLIGGIDFGYRAPTAMLLAMVDDDGTVYVVDELVRSGLLAEQFMKLADDRCRSHGWPRPQWIGADPAGHQRSDQTGESTIALWRRSGWAIRTHAMPIEPGVEAVRRRLRRADGAIGLRIHRRCTALIEALEKYHYPPSRPECTLPVKDGPDHICDALRYMIINLDRAARPVRRSGY